MKAFFNELVKIESDGLGFRILWLKISIVKMKRYIFISIVGARLKKKHFLIKLYIYSRIEKVTVAIFITIYSMFIWF